MIIVKMVESSLFPSQCVDRNLRSCPPWEGRVSLGGTQVGSHPLDILWTAPNDRLVGFQQLDKSIVFCLHPEETFRGQPYGDMKEYAGGGSPAPTSSEHLFLLRVFTDPVSKAWLTWCSNPWSSLMQGP